MLLSVNDVNHLNTMLERFCKIHLLLSVNDVNHLNTMLERFCSLTKLLRVTAWIRRFTNNIKGNVKLIGELSAEEIGNALNFWIKLVQQEASNMEGYQQVAQRLNIVQNNEGILVCKGRISGEYPVFLPNTHKFF